jgi:uncharacterized protein (DUF2384 family)
LAKDLVEEDILQRNFLQIILDTRLTHRISSSKLYEKYDSIPLSRAIMIERLKCLVHSLQTKDDRLPKIVLVCKTSWEKRKADRP